MSERCQIIFPPVLLLQCACRDGRLVLGSGKINRPAPFYGAHEECTVSRGSILGGVFARRLRGMKEDVATVRR